MFLNRIKKFILLAGDVAALYAALLFTLLLRYRSDFTDTIWSQHLLPFTLLFLLWLLVFFINGLYEIGGSKNDVEFYNKIVRNLLINYGLAAVYFYLLAGRLFNIRPLTVFFIYTIVATVIFIAWRYWYNTFVQAPYLLRNVLVIGMNDEARELIEEVINKPQLGFQITTVIHDGWHRSRTQLPGVEVLPGTVNIKQVIQKRRISAVVTALDAHGDPELTRKLYDCLTLKLQFFDLPTFYERLTGKIPVTNIGHIWFLENLAEGEKKFYELLKRLFDLVVATASFVIFLPFLPLIALAIKLDSPGPVLFRQTRVGSLGKPFQVLKFRGMFLDAEKDGPQWAKKNDKRVTRVGRLLRKTRLDELPQLLAIIKGEMSIVGPRPERPEFIRTLQEIIPFYNERHLVKPGVTGWAQINFPYGSSAGDTLKKLQYDLFYIKNRSLLLDIGIILKTINIMFTGRGQ